MSRKIHLMTLVDSLRIPRPLTTAPQTCITQAKEGRPYLALSCSLFWHPGKVFVKAPMCASRSFKSSKSLPVTSYSAGTVDNKPRVSATMRSWNFGSRTSAEPSIG